MPIKESDIEVTDPRLVDAAKNNQSIPPAYISIELSTKGRLGAPALFHAKNFSTEDLLSLSLAEDEELPKRVCEMLDNLIYEKDVSVKVFHEQEVVEFLLIIYRVFFTPVLKDLDFQVTDEDKKWIADNFGGVDSDDVRGRLRSLENKTWQPKFDINLETLQYYKIPEDFKSSVKVSKKNGFTATFSFPRYGSVVTLREFLKHIYKEQDKKFASLLDTLKFSQDAKDRFLKGENINIASLPKIPEAQLKEIKEYEAEKSVFAMQATRACHLVEYKGTDVSEWPLEKRIELAKDPELDYNVFKQVSDYFGKLECGVNKEIEIVNPIQNNKRMKRRYSFRLYDIFQAVQRGESDGITLSFV